MPPDEPATVAAPDRIEPQVAIALHENIARPRFGAAGGLVIVDPEEGPVATLAADAVVTAAARGDLVLLEGAGVPLARRVWELRAARAGDPVRLDGRSYEGTLELRRGADGVRIVNRLPLEEYLVGVVSAEMGRRTVAERAALEAQAVAARTYAVRHLGRGARDGYDLVATIDAQVYRGSEAEQPLAREAVAATRGEILTWDGAPIDAFYSSTCGGHTEAAGSVFIGGDRPYLPARPDVAADGTPWCAISPRYRWQEEWSPSQLAAILQRTLAAETLSAARAGDLAEMRVLDRTASGRIAVLELAGARGRTSIRGSAIRRVLQPVRGGLLWSADFTVRISRRGGRIERITAEGRGAGHGVGMCQWGAIGRSRAGQDYRTILASYYPGAELVAAY